MPKWADGTAVGPWDGDFVVQRRLLFKILTRFSVGWALHGIASMGVKINLSLITSDSVLKVKFVARRPGEKDVHDDIELRGDRLPSRFPATVVVRPLDTLRKGEPTDFIAIVDYSWHPDEASNRVAFTLRAAGRDQPDDDTTSLK